ncbi:MAG TPA: beta-N-acetylhexosaminidase [Verrucomicrobiae bacterium]|nr:beta-N-acetylhexosaminidase [Verrucomicrobiae bacterium]
MTRLAYRLKPAGQLLIIGFDGRQMTPGLRALLDWVQPAGVILFARNIQSAEQTWQLLRECQRCVATPLFTCIDLEGGSVDRLRDLMGPTPAATDVFATGDRSMFRKHGELIAANCRALGFNVDFAPVLDLAFPASLKVMGSRTVSADPRKTTTYAREFLQGFDNGGVLGCGKHFPGLGEGRLDSHHKLPVIEKPLRKLWNEDLLPYRNLRRRLPFVMVSHAAYPKVSGQKVPATLSKSWISGILRRRIGYRNLIVSDDLEMGGLLSAASVGEAAIEFVRAGGDLCLVCHREDRVLEACETLTKTIERDKKFARRAAESQRRLLAFKKKHAKQLRGVRRPSATTIEKLRRKLWEFGEQVRLENLEHPESAAHE